MRLWSELTLLVQVVALLFSVCLKNTGRFPGYPVLHPSISDSDTPLPLPSNPCSPSPRPVISLQFSRIFVFFWRPQSSSLSKIALYCGMQIFFTIFFFASLLSELKSIFSIGKIRLAPPPESFEMRQHYTPQWRK